MQKLWRTKEWKEKRAEIIKERGRCEQCGSTEHLAIHHPTHPNTNGLWNEIGYNLFLKSNEFKKLPDRKRRICPKCGSSSSYFHARKTMMPKYKCSKCGCTFNHPKMVDDRRIFYHVEQESPTDGRPKKDGVLTSKR